MKAYLAWAKKTVGAGIAFTVLWLSTLTTATIPSWVPVKYLPVVTLLVGLAGTYSVWKLENGPKPTPTFDPPVGS
jgi:hypothetical protein